MPARTRPAPVQDVAAAIALLTRLPVPRTAARGARAAWAYPVAGALVGGLAGLVALAASGAGLPAGVAAGFVLAAQIMLTGALHEDGLADTADGFWGGWDRARRLEIMKDSRIGSYGVLALGLSLLLRWSALSLLMVAGDALAVLVAVGALSRAPMVAVMWGLRPARGTAGLSAEVGRPKAAAVSIALTLGVGSAVLLLGAAALPAALAMAAATAAVALIARAKIGGQTGDVLGAVQQTAEIAILVALVAQ